MRLLHVLINLPTLNLIISGNWKLEQSSWWVGEGSFLPRVWQRAILSHSRCFLTLIPLVANILQKGGCMADIFKAVMRDVMVSFCSYANKSLNSPFQFYFMSAHASKAPFSPAPPPFALWITTPPLLSLQVFEYLFAQKQAGASDLSNEPAFCFQTMGPRHTRHD